MRVLFSLFFSIFLGVALKAQDKELSVKPTEKVKEVLPLSEHCLQSLKKFPGLVEENHLKQICAKVESYPECFSQEDHLPIFHFDKMGTHPGSKKVLVLALFHGDEHPAGTLARHWMSRLLSIDSRNSWRVVPIINPDGLSRGVRVNGRGIDLNRNLPTVHWEDEALERWKTVEKKNERRFPGSKAGSEQEVTCLLKEISEYSPDFVISLHTPYGLLDFDGPESAKAPLKLLDLPWKGLGNYPGSLGRYLWAERSVPVLTVELKSNKLYQNANYMNQLQDKIGSFVVGLINEEKPSAASPTIKTQVSDSLPLARPSSTKRL